MVIHSGIVEQWMVTSFFISDTQHNIQETDGDRKEKKISLYLPDIYSLDSQEIQPVDRSMLSLCHNVSEYLYMSQWQSKSDLVINPGD